MGPIVVSCRLKSLHLPCQRFRSKARQWRTPADDWCVRATRTGRQRSSSGHKRSPKKVYSNPYLLRVGQCTWHDWSDLLHLGHSWLTFSNPTPHSIVDLGLGSVQLLSCPSRLPMRRSCFKLHEFWRTNRGSQFCKGIDVMFWFEEITWVGSTNFPHDGLHADDTFLELSWWAPRRER